MAFFQRARHALAVITASILLLTMLTGSGLAASGIGTLVPEQGGASVTRVPVDGGGGSPVTTIPIDGGGSGRSAPAGITVMVNGKVVSLPADRQPYVVNDRTMFPLRYLLEMLGAEVGWGYPSDSDAQVAWVQESDTLMGFPIGQNYMVFDGEFVPLDQGAVLSGAGYTMVPMRAVIERLGGQVEWDARTRTAKFTYARSADMRSIRRKCQLHGYNIDWAPSTPGACTQNLFFIPDALVSYGHDTIKEWVHKGLMADGYVVQYLNTVAAAHHDSPPRTTRQALDETVNQVITDIAIAELIGMVWRPVDEEPAPGKERKVQPAAFAPPRTNGWAENEQFMSEEHIAYQSEISAKVYRPSGRGTAGKTGWIIEEYGYGVDGVKKKWFDARIGNTLVDAKSHGAELMNGTQLKINPGTKHIFDGMITDAVEQLAAAGDLKVAWYFRNEGFMKALRGYFDTSAPSVAKQLQWVHHP